ncbi:chaperone modulator CbpM [Marinobacter caseinilyticus]|uniref:chaperone modulator CbpM n=1 Tax=Marinobacter caseinilyticus TaxID=2692195 RepID=UPI00140DA9DB|nr:chaperone modulator CbpM [Marinobacter caseinilyticus]
MSKHTQWVDVGTLEQTTFTLSEICDHSELHAEFVIKLVNYGVIAPVTGDDARTWSFDLPALTRLQKAQRLQRDLRVNLPGLAVSLDLLDDIDALRREVDNLHQRLRQLMQE